jgi:GNAT superfamily N-acetyltransferase
MRVREAREGDLSAAMNVLDAGLLDVTPEQVRSGTTLVAVEEGRVLGALVLDGGEIAAVAVRRARRDQGIGRALVAAAADRRERLVAEFDPRVRPFYESLGFDVRTADESGRLWGVLDGDGPADGA